MIFGQTQSINAIDPDELQKAIESRPTPLPEYFGAVVRQSFDSTIPGVVYNNAQVPDDDRIAAPVAGNGRSGVTHYIRTGVPILSEDEFKASPDYREGIPYDDRMTQARAKAKADVYDADRYNSWLRQNRAWGAGTVAALVAGSVIGSAPDPVNYIPVFGPAFKVANAGRLATIMARAGIGAAENIAGTAVEEPTIANSRRQFGDDISFADQISDIAMAGLFGAALGAVHGGGERIERVKDRAPEKVASALQTLGEGAQAVADDRPIDIAGPHRAALLSGTSLGRSGEFTPDATAPRLAPDTLAPVRDRITALDQQIAGMEAAGQQVSGGTKLVDLYRERSSLLETARNSVPEETWADGIKSALYKETKSPKLQQARLDLADVENKISKMEDSGRQAMAGDRLTDLRRQRVGILQNVEALLPTAPRDQLGRDLLEQDTRPASAELDQGIPALPPPATRSAFEQAFEDTAQRPRAAVARSVSTVAQDPKPTSRETAVATASEAAVGKPARWDDAGLKETAQAHGINPETGDFEEMADIKRLDKAEQLTTAEHDTLDAHDAEIKRTDDYRRAFEQAATCLMGGV